MANVTGGQPLESHGSRVAPDISAALMSVVWTLIVTIAPS